MRITTRAQLDEALRRVFVDAIADERRESEPRESGDELVTLASRDRRVAPLERLTVPVRRVRPKTKATR
jgi:hypothetical protein